MHTSISDLTESVIGVKGDKKEVDQFVAMHDLLSLSDKLPGTVMAVVKVNHFIHRENYPNLMFSNLTANEAFIHLTNQQDGGIDHVFDRSNVV